MEAPTTISMTHDQILCACYDWLESRGLRPSDATRMRLDLGDSVLYATDERFERCRMVFECDAPAGELCWDEDGLMYPYFDRKSAPWLREPRPQAPSANPSSTAALPSAQMDLYGQ